MDLKTMKIIKENTYKDLIKQRLHFKIGIERPLSEGG